MLFAIFLAISIFILCTRPAAAYLDPGSGSFIFQIVAAAILGSLFTVKLYARKLIGVIKKISGQEKNKGDRTEEKNAKTS